MGMIRRTWRSGSLTIVLALCFLASLTAQVLAGQASDNQKIVEEGGVPRGLVEYLRSGHFVEATFENWESEFLQMAMYVMLTVKLHQRGSAESRPIDHPDKPEIEKGPVPGPVLAGGWALALYKRSLFLAFSLLLVSLSLHLVGSWRDEMFERALKGESAITLAQWAGNPQFWFESFQNWQSEFLAVLSLVVLSIWLRHDGSAQPKPVSAHLQTGS